jgi:hypothetical protein
MRCAWAVNGEPDIGFLVQGASVVFGMTDYPSILQREIARVGGDPAKLGPDSNERLQAMEISSGKTLADAVAAIANSTLERFVWSELPAVKEISNGKYSHAFHFDSKAIVSAYIRSAHPDLAKKTGYLRLAPYMNNWKRIPALGLVKVNIHRAQCTFFQMPWLITVTSIVFVVDRRWYL